tara:strand:- start:41320 stop:42090 length:771 start_codon:yes stop_codon:yes gene_type:complete
MKSIIIVPARLESKRLPEKVLEDIAGKPMLRWVLERCKQSRLADELFLCTDNNKLVQLAKDCNVETLLTGKNFKSGTDRIASVINKVCNDLNLNNTLIINVQGDQPFIDPNVIDQMIEEFRNKNFFPKVMTPVYKLDQEFIHNPNVVKTILNQSQQAIYFSRSAIPHIRDEPKESWFKNYDYWGHVGIYGYRADIIFNWPLLRKSLLEESERLEQLRFIDNGICIDTFAVKGSFLSIDTAEQLSKARNIAKNIQEI